jgi:Family of unknown function (DUF6272)
MVEQGNVTLFKYEGCVDQHLVGNVNYNIKNNCSFRQIEKIDQKNKKLIIIAVELLQNIMKHANNYLQPDSVCNPSEIFISHNKSENNVTFKIKNKLETEVLDKFIGKLDYANSLNKEELNAAYTKQLKNGILSEKNGAGLGLFEIRRIAGNKIEYFTEKINAEYANCSYLITYNL